MPLPTEKNVYCVIRSPHKYRAYKPAFLSVRNLLVQEEQRLISQVYRYY